MDQVQQPQAEAAPTQAPGLSDMLNYMRAEGVKAAQQSMAEQLHPLVTQAKSQEEALQAETGKRSSRFALPGFAIGTAAAIGAAFLAPVSIPLVAIGGIAAVGGLLGRVAGNAIGNAVMPKNEASKELEVQLNATNDRIREMISNGKAPEEVWLNFRNAAERTARQYANDYNIDANDLLRSFYGKNEPGSEFRLEFPAPSGNLNFSFDITDQVIERTQNLDGFVKLASMQAAGKGGSRSESVEQSRAQEAAVPTTAA